MKMAAEKCVSIQNRAIVMVPATPAYLEEVGITIEGNEFKGKMDKLSGIYKTPEGNICFVPRHHKTLHLCTDINIVDPFDGSSNT